MARKQSIAATIVKLQDGDKATGKSAYLRIEASNGQTYYRVADPFRKTSIVTYGVWSTDSREPDKAISLSAMPKSVRDLMRANPNPFAA